VFWKLLKTPSKMGIIRRVKQKIGRWKDMLWFNNCGVWQIALKLWRWYSQKPALPSNELTAGRSIVYCCKQWLVRFQITAEMECGNSELDRMVGMNGLSGMMLEE